MILVRIIRWPSLILKSHPMSMLGKPKLNTTGSSHLENRGGPVVVIMYSYVYTHAAVLIHIYILCTIHNITDEIIIWYCGNESDIWKIITVILYMH